MADFFDFIKNKTSNTSTNGGPAPQTPIPAVPVAPTPTSVPQTPKVEVGKVVNVGQDVVAEPPKAPINTPNPSVPGSPPPAVPQTPTGDAKTDNKVGDKPPQTPDQATNKAANQASNSLDLMTHLTQRSNRVFMSATSKAKELGAEFIDSEHILHGLVADPEIYNFFTEVKIQPQVIETELMAIYKRNPAPAPLKPPQPSPRVKRILDGALIAARKLGFEFISPEHLLLSLYEEGEGAGARVLAKLGLKKEELNKKITGRKEGLTDDQKAAEKKKKALEEFTIDLTAKASQGLLDPVVERSQVIERVIHILSRRTKNNPSLVGEAGVGKTAVVEGLAEKIVAKEVPESLLNKRILQLDLMSILAGASHRGDFEERMKDLIEEVKASNGTIILFIDEIHNIVGAGSSGEGSLDASNFLKPALARGEIQLIGATTLTEYRKYIEKDPALERRFQPVLVPEPTEEAAIKMLGSIKDKYEAFHRVKIPQDVIEAAVRLSKRYVGDRFLPDKAVDLIDEAASAVRLPLISLPEEIKSSETRIAELTQELKEAEKKVDKIKCRILKSKIDEIQSDLKVKKDEYNLKKSQTTTSVTPSIIQDIVSRWTGIPVSKITSSETEKLANLEDIIHKRLINQEAAVSSVAQAVRRGRAGLKSASRPIGSFVFLGPTGVGKTELAKTLADILFGSEDLMIRFDMTEYMEKHEVAKLLGAPPGYVGYEEGGKLTEAVRRKPYSVVLFDEIEKANPDIFNILLQILDDGRLTDNRGHVVSFKNTVVICTSNIGTKLIQDEMLKKINPPPESKPTTKPEAKGKSKPQDEKKQNSEKPKNDFEEIKTKVMAELLKFFKPELVNRFDEVMVFEPLKYEHIAQIVKLQLKGLTKMLEDQELGLYYTDQVIEQIVQDGFDPVYGARPLKRVIQKLMENPISNLIINSKVKPGDVIKVRMEQDNFVFDVEKTEMVDVVLKEFKCQKCGAEFKTEIIKNSTTICPKCAGHSFVPVEPKTPEPAITTKPEDKPKQEENVKKMEPVTKPIEPAKDDLVKDKKPDEK